jgi:hypothetical protein
MISGKDREPSMNKVTTIGFWLVLPAGALLPNSRSRDI